MNRRAAALIGWAALVALPPGLAAAEGTETITTARDVSRRVRTCWVVPDGLKGFERLEATVRFSLKIDGSLQGERRIAFMPFPGDERARILLARSVVEAVERCAPFPISAALGNAIAGRVLAVRFIYVGPRGQGA